MRKLFKTMAFTLLGLVLSSNVWAEDPVVLFHESFGDNSSSARVWDNTYSVKSGVADVYSSVSYTMTNVKQGKNTTGKIQSGLAQSTAGTDAIFEFGPLDVSDYKSLVLSYYWKAASTKGTYTTAIYYKTSQAGTYNLIAPTAAGASSFVWVSENIPEAADNCGTLYIKIVFNTSNTQAVIDEVEITGEKGSTPVSTTKTIYCKMEYDWWKNGGAVGCHSWGTGAETTWPGVRMTPVEGETDMWYIELDTTKVQNVIFTRVNPSDEGDLYYGAKTKEQVIPTDDKNLFTITTSSAIWDDPGCEGTWSKYVPTPPCTPSFGLMVDETTYQEGTFNSTDSQWEVKGVSLTENQTLTLYNKCGETAFMPKAGNFGEVFDADEAMTVQETAVYDFYIKLISGADELWVVKHVPEVLPQITEAPKSWAGEYVISYMKDVNNALVWTGIDAGQCRVETPVIDGKVTMVEPVKVIVEAMDGGGYSVKVKGGTNDGKYVTQKATPDYNNALNFVTTPVRVDIEMNDKGLVDFYQVINEEQKMYLLYNATSGASNERFRFYKGSNYGGSTYKSLTLFGTVAPVISYTDSTYYVAGNFTNWAAGMQALPYEVELPKDSVLEFKQIMLRTKLSDGDSIGQDTLWYGQENDGEYMTRESNTWMLNGGYNVLAKTDIAGSYTFSLNENGEFVMTWPKEPVITYKDSVYYVAGNFTNWAAGMQALPYEVELPKDSVLEFKQIMLRTVLSDGDSIGQDTTWFGQENEKGSMTRDNSTWALQENGYNVYATTDIAGTYTFALNENGEFVLTFPELCTPNFGLLVNGTTYYEGTENTEKGQWEVLSVKLNAGDMLQVKDTCSGEVWVPANIDHTEYFGKGGGLKDGGVYSFYLKLSLGNDELYIVKESSTGLDYMFEAKSNPYKTFREGNLFIIVGENVYTTQGVRVK